MAFRPAGYLEEEEDEDGEFYFGDEYNVNTTSTYSVVKTTFSPTSNNLGADERYLESTRSSSLNGCTMCRSRSCSCCSSEGEINSAFSMSSSMDSPIKFVMPSGGVDQYKSEDKIHEDCPECMADSGIGTRGGGAFSQPSLIGGRGKLKMTKPYSSLKRMESTVDMKVAIAKGNVEQVTKLLDEGVDLNHSLSSSWPPLLHACENGQESIVKLLLDRGADPNTSKDQLSALMVTCMNKPTSLQHKPEACVRLLLESGAVVNSRDRHHMTPLLYACQSSQLSLIRLLITSSADVNAADSRGWTPLFFAASKGHIALLRLLVESGADPTATCNQGESLYSVAYSNSHKAAADWLESLTSSNIRGCCSGVGRLPDQSVVPPPRSADRKTGCYISEFPVNSPPAVDNCNPVLHTYAPQTSAPQTSAPQTSAPQTNGLQTNGLQTSDSQTSASTLSLGVGTIGTAVGDLEIFLMGLQLGELIPVFHDHNVEFSQLLSMTDADLLLMGVAKVGSRKKILNAVLELHKNEWPMPVTTLPYNRLVSSGELCVMLSHLSRHSNYLQGSAHFILTHLQSNSDVVGPHMEPTELKALTESLSSAVKASQLLHEKVCTLKNSILQLVPPNTIIPDHMSESGTRSSLFPYVPGMMKLVLGVGIVMSVGVYMYLRRTLLPVPSRQ